MDEPYLRSRFLQLQNAHNTHVVVMSKNRDLARMLRPEFGKCVYFEDAKKCIRYIAAANHNPELPGGVDAVVIDYDNLKIQEPLKVLEFMNKRSKDPLTAKLPLIVSVTLLSTCDTDSERSFVEHVEHAGGSNFLIKNPYMTRAVLYALIEGVYNNKNVETTYKDLRHKQVKFKYPYFPTFKDVKVKKMRKLLEEDDEEDEDEDEDDFDGRAHRKTSVSIRPSLLRSISKNRMGSSTSLTGMRSIAEYTPGKNNSTTNDDSSYDSELPDSVNDWTDTSSLLPPFIRNVREEEMGFLSESLDHRDPDVLRLRHLATDSVVEKMVRGEGCLSVDETGNGEEKPDGLRRYGTQIVRDELSAGREAGTSVLVRALLDPDLRPKWGGVNASTATDYSTGEQGKADMRVFFDRPRPDLAVLHTIGGLDQRSASQCWKVMKARIAQSSKKAAVNRPTDRDMESSVGLQESLQGSLDASGEFERRPNSRPSTVGGERRKSTEGQSNLKLSIKAVERAERTLRKMAREAAPDLQIDRIREVDFVQRHHYCGEKDIYEQGLRCEKSGHTDEATTFYTRAGLHSREPHLSKIFLGILSYKQRQFMTSLLHLNNAIMIQENAPSSSYIQYDDFIAHFNRGIVKLRLGDDDGGVADIKRACDLDQKDLSAAEMYALALRRQKQYSSSIDLIKENKRLRMLRETEEGLAKEEEVLKKERKKAKDAEMKKQMGRMSLFGDRHSLIHGKSHAMTQVNLQSLSKHEVLQALHEHTKGHKPSYQRGSRFGSVGGMHTSRGSVFRKSAFIMKSSSELGERAFFGPRVGVEDGVDGGLRSRVTKALAQTNKASGTSGAEDGESVGEGLASDALDSFKASLGLREDLFESICVKPSPLQVALACSPYLRKQHHIDIISVALRLVPFLARFSISTITKLATVVEYRAISHSGKLFQQNVPPDAVIFLLSGSVRMSMETGRLSPDVHVGDCQPFDAIGHKDMLFNYGESLYVSELKKLSEKDLQDTKRRERELEGGEGEEEEAVDSGEEVKEEHDVFQTFFRATEPGLFSVYESTGITEIIMFEQEMFNYAIRSQVEDEIAKILEGIASCGCFKTLPLHERIRMARMGVLRTYKAGHVFVEQAEQADYLFIIMKGTCKAYKRPNLSEIYARILSGLKQKALSHDVTFAFHHKLRDTLSKPVDVADPAQLDTVAAKLGSRKEHVTETELNRHILGLEISKYESLLKKSQAQEMQDDLERDSLETVNLADMMCEIAILNWPMIFGESCVLDFENSRSRATITADTTVEVFLLHKNQLATFAVDEALQRGVASKAIRYPDDKELVSKLESEKSWARYKESVLETIPKTRWIKPISEQTVHFI